MIREKLDLVTIGETMALFTPNRQGYLRYANEYSRSFVGSETNVSIGISRMGYRAGWISRVGKDEFGKAMIMALKGESIDLSFVTEDEEASTGLMFKEYLRRGKARVFYYRRHSAASKIGIEDIDKNYIRRAKYLFVSGITPALSVSCREAVFYAIKVAKESNVQVVFDPNLRRSLWDENDSRTTLIEIAKNADYILPGIQEGEFLFHTDNVNQIGRKFLEMGASVVVIKLGKDGALYLSKKENKYVPSYSVEEVIDPIGAGDAFAAGFISGLLDNLSLYDSVKRANAFGALATQVRGDIEGLPEREQLAQFMGMDKEDVDR